MCIIAMPHAATYEMNPSHSRTQVTGAIALTGLDADR